MADKELTEKERAELHREGTLAVKKLTEGTTVTDPGPGYIGHSAVTDEMRNAATLGGQVARLAKQAAPAGGAEKVASKPEDLSFAILKQQAEGLGVTVNPGTSKVKLIETLTAGGFVFKDGLYVAGEITPEGDQAGGGADPNAGGSGGE